MGKAATRPTATNWSSSAFVANERYDAWVEVLNRTYGYWQVPVSRDDDFAAELSIQNFDGFSVADCICDPCGGQRRSQHVDSVDQEVLAIQLTLDGRELIRFANEDFYLEPGDIMIWDSARPMLFDVQERLHKISLILPLQRLKHWLPNSWHKIPGRIPANTPDGALISSFVLALARNDFSQCAVNCDALLEAGVALLAGTAVNDQTEDGSRSLKDTQLRSVKSYIAKHLGDPEMTLESIATANRISLRYLHWLFASTGKTALQYLQEERLLRCRRDLENPAMLHRTISDIALCWGFSNPTHFARRFKQRYGVCPSDVRPA